MGQKAHPYGLRLGIVKTWKSKWFATRKEARQYLRKNEMKYGWGDVYIAERINGKMVVG